MKFVEGLKAHHHHEIGRTVGEFADHQNGAHRHYVLDDVGHGTAADLDLDDTEGLPHMIEIENGKNL